jgi:hypothetical protein
MPSASGGLKADAVGVWIVVVSVQRELDAQSGERQRRAGGFGHDAAAFLNKTPSDSPRLAPETWIFVKQGRLFYFARSLTPRPGRTSAIAIMRT